MGTRYVNLEKWRGLRDATVIAPESTPFKAVAATYKCRGCLFNGQWAEVCMKATKVAVRSTMADCDDGYVYVAVETDPRQLDLIKENAA